MKGCDEYQANFSRSGLYTMIYLPGRGTMAKMSANGAEFLEVTTLGIDTLVSFGHCVRE
jgi:hypothetical protein